MMKNLFILLFLLCGLNAQAQTDSVIYYNDGISSKYDTLRPYMINTIIHYGTDSVTNDSNYVWQFYHYIQKINDSTFIYQPQFVIHDSLNNRLLPNTDLIGGSWRSNGTVKEFTVDSNFINLTPIQQRDSLIFNQLKTVYGSSNVIKE